MKDRLHWCMYVKMQKIKKKVEKKMLNAIAIFVGIVFNILQRLSVIVCCFCAVHQICTVM